MIFELFDPLTGLLVWYSLYASNHVRNLVSGMLTVGRMSDFPVIGRRKKSALIYPLHLPTIVHKMISINDDVFFRNSFASYQKTGTKNEGDRSSVLHH